MSCFCLRNQAICGVTVYTYEARLLKFLLQHLHERRVELTIEQQYAVTLFFGRLYVSILLLFAVRIKVNEVTIFVCLLSSDELLILFKGIIFPADVFQQGISLGTIKEILLAEHTIVDKEFQVVPFLLESLAIFLEDALQTIRNLLHNIAGYLLYVRIALQITSTYVQRNIRRINDAMKQR